MHGYADHSRSQYPGPIGMLVCPVCNGPCRNQEHHKPMFRPVPPVFPQFPIPDPSRFLSVEIQDAPQDLKKASKAGVAARPVTKGKAKKTPKDLPRPFCCDVCDKTFTKDTYLIQHRRIHTGERPFVCEICNKTFTQSGHLVNHKRVHVGDRPFTCELCNKAFAHSRNLISNRGSSFFCRRHRRAHSGERPFSCDQCGKSFLQAEHLNNHRRRIHQGERLSCRECGKSFSHAFNLERHARIHTGERPYECNHCEKSFNQSTHLNNHVKCHGKSGSDRVGNSEEILSSPEPALPAAGPGPKMQDSFSQTNEGMPRSDANPAIVIVLNIRFLYNIVLLGKDVFCRMQFVRRDVQGGCDEGLRLMNYGLDRRQLLPLSTDGQHFNPRPCENSSVALQCYWCTICALRFATPQECIEHMKIAHTVQVVQPSQYSSHTVPHSSPAVKCELKADEETETDDKPEDKGSKKSRRYACDVCPKAFMQAGHLANHKAVHAGGEKPFSCSVCNKQFAHSRNLGRHMRCHTGERPHECNMCGKRFFQGEHLAQHKKSHEGPTLTYKSARERHKKEMHRGSDQIPEALERSPQLPVNMNVDHKTRVIEKDALHIANTRSSDMLCTSHPVQNAVQSLMDHGASSGTLNSNRKT
ncbi:unnamed protein product [Notodromas monacha]|uniref:C2H2-type domain-containing protein n=1 Tax=Notodromas monacha TaxID=399045 RepID=A0A7R9GCB4_9CRUS|nr:unnamed protein product [Notodromas monacha]CAG0915914.1 unnamed protein product [Notodromas monacha]